MKTNALCPISDKKIKESVARFNASFTVLLLIIFVITQSILPLLFLFIDFLLRSTEYSKYSLIGFFSKSIVKYLSLNHNLINAGPKIFAARIGSILSSLIILTFFLGFYLPAFALAGILGLFSFLEAAFGLCVACEIYPLIYKFLYKVRFQEF